MAQAITPDRKGFKVVRYCEYTLEEMKAAFEAGFQQAKLNPIETYSGNTKLEEKFEEWIGDELWKGRIKKLK